jgi:hypothetical protein
LAFITARAVAAASFVTIYTVPAGQTFFMSAVTVAVFGTTVAGTDSEIWINYNSASDVETFLQSGTEGANTLKRDWTRPITIPGGQAILGISAGYGGGGVSIDATVKGTLV